MTGSQWREVVAEWQGEDNFLARNLRGGSIQIGELDGNRGLSPMELLLAGLAGCTGIDVASTLKKQRQRVQNLQVRARGKRAESHPRVYTEIEVTYLIWGEDLDSRAIERAIQLSEEKYCSASAMLGAVARLTSSYRILAPGEAETDGWEEKAV